MLLHVIIVALECAALAAFLILWYLVLKKKLQGSFVREAGQRILLRFRYFSWVLIALVLVTCLVQIHFVWLSSQIQEEMTSVNRSMQDQRMSAPALDEIKDQIDKLRRQADSSVKELRALSLTYQRSQMLASVTPTDPSIAQASPQDRQTTSASQAFKKDTEKGAFAKEARASSASRFKDMTVAGLRKGEDQQTREAFSMRLNRMGSVTKSGLRVRKQPSQTSDVVEKLPSGQQVKVTEKRLIGDTVWFRVITPSGIAGWVDYRYLKLEVKADTPSI